MAAANKFQFLIRRSQLYLLRQVWAMEFGTNTGTGTGLSVGKGGIQLSPDDSTIFIPFDPNTNSDYYPTAANSEPTYTGKQGVGLLALAADTGSAISCNIYLTSLSGTVVPVGGKFSVDSSRYFYLVKVDVFTYILVLGSDGTVKSMTKFGSDGTHPLALAASKLDRIAWNTIVRAGTSSPLAASNT